MSEEDKRVCTDCGEALEEDDWSECDECEVDLCEGCAAIGMIGDDSYQLTYCSTCRSERERLQGGEEAR